jgi:hypothetical protein
MVAGAVLRECACQDRPVTLETSASRPRSVLLTQAHLSRHAGSEMVTIELAEHFAALGAAVSVLTHVVSDEIRAELEEAGVSVLLTGERGEDAAGGTSRPDLAWIHHGLIPASLAARPGGTRFVFNHMSAVHPLEFDLSGGVEEALASVSAYNSPETLRVHEAAGLVSSRSSRVVFANPAPDGFGGPDGLGDAGDETARDDGPVLVVSNHPPVELLEALDDLGGDIVRVGDGADGFEARRVHPELLRSARAVVTIGKTVQYALLARVAVYCYDVFGGPGWLTEENFDEAADRNFSGRGFGQKSSDEIRIELLSGSPSAADVSHRLSRALGLIFDELASSAEAAAVGPAVLEAHGRRMDLQRMNVISATTLARASKEWQDERRRSRERIEELRSTIADRDARLREALASSPAGASSSLGEDERASSRARIAELRGVIRERDERLRGLLRDQSAASTERDRGARQLADAKKKIADSDDRRQHLEEARDAASARARAAEKELLAIEGSFAYQLTAPLRRFEARRREDSSE